MSRHPPHETPAPAQRVADKVFNTLERFLYVEAVSGIVLLIAAAAALIWANSPAGEGYQHLWHAPVTFAFAGFVISQPLHFLINDGLMTIFFLVVGMEIRREIYEGTLSDLRSATLPFAAAAGGVIVPALIYVALNREPGTHDGWAVPTATDIAFAVGVLALLGRSIPSPVRAFLLALAIIDDIVAVLIIALFYSEGLAWSGLAIAAVGVLIVLGLQRIGVRNALAYVLPGAIVWAGLLRMGVHPTLAGVVLGLMTPVLPLRGKEAPVKTAERALHDIDRRAGGEHQDPHEFAEPYRQLREAQRELVAPAVRVQMALHPWVAFGVMPLFALANAGVPLQGIDFDAAAPKSVVLGVILALVIGKPVGILLGSWLAVKMRWSRLPERVTWHGVLLVGFLGGIGFTMSIFIAGLAFGDRELLMAAKVGVLVASVAAGVIGLLLGHFYVKGQGRDRSDEDLPTPQQERA